MQLVADWQYCQGKAIKQIIQFSPPFKITGTLFSNVQRLVIIHVIFKININSSTNICTPILTNICSEITPFFSSYDQYFSENNLVNASS